MVQRPEQEAAKPATLPVGSAQRAFLQEVDKEILREVLRVLPAITASSDKRVNRVTIGTIERIQSRAGFPRPSAEAVVTNPH